MARRLPGADPEGPADPHGDLAGALHDVSNALTVLLGWVAEARAEGAPHETVAYALGMVEGRARAARDLARRVLGARTGGPESRQNDEDLALVLADVTTALMVEAERAGVTLARPAPGGAARLRAAADIHHVLTNLLLNAIAFSPRGSTVSLEVAVEATAIVLEVVDAGPGIPAERHESIFAGDSTREGGAGVGLRHARALARAAGGDLTVVGPGTDAPSPSGRAGARFRLRWPRVSAAATPVPPPSPSQSTSRLRILDGKRILLVEDDGDVVDLLDTALEARGATVTVARTREELTEILSVQGGEPLDTALVDLSPLAADLAGALRELRRHSPAIDIVFITGSAAPEPVLVETASARWVRKPFEVGEVVTEILRGREPR